MPPLCAYSSRRTARWHLLADQLVGVALRQRLQPQLAHAAVARRRLERGEHRCRELPVAERQRAEDPRGRGSPQQVHEELERRLVRPVQVIEDDDQRLPGGERHEQRAHRAMGAEALVLQRGERHVGRGDGGQHPRQLGQALAHQLLQPAGCERRDVIVERGHPDAERELLLHLRAAAHEHQAAAGVGAVGQLGQQARLAAAGLAAHHHPAHAGRAQTVERRGQAGELRAASNESAALRLGHGLRA